MNLSEIFTKEEIEKLPKWAVSKINILQMRATEYKNELNRINENAPSNTIVGFRSRISEDEQTTYLKNGQLITFILNSEDYVTGMVRDGVLDINGSSSLITVHKVSNHFEIKPNK
jgi:hypothetical protein